jgi:hypothetical protein
MVKVFFVRRFWNTNIRLWANFSARLLCEAGSARFQKWCTGDFPTSSNFAQGSLVHFFSSSKKASCIKKQKALFR